MGQRGTRQRGDRDQRRQAVTTRSFRRRSRVIALAVGAALLFVLVPTVTMTPALSTVVLAADGTLLGAHIAADGQWRFARTASLPDNYVAALKRYEDRRFSWHLGVDPIAVARAFWANLRAGAVVSGASTLTMQAVRLSRRGESRTYGEKLIEALLAVRLELAKSKVEILQMYADNAPFGGNVVGLEAAAWRYFGHGPQTLSWAEAATLAVLPNSPGLVHPGRGRNRLSSRRDRLLDDLQRAGVIETTTCALAKSEPLPEQPLPVPQWAPHLVSRIETERPSQHAAVVTTTLDANLQRQVRQLVIRHHNRLQGAGIHSAAVLVLRVDDGGVLAYVGNAQDPTSEIEGEYVDVVMAPRSPGSILKPLLYAGALDAGELLPTEILEDIPIRIGGFAPENFSRTYSGAVPAATALARSLNVPAVRLLQDFGVDRFYGLLRRLGMSTLKRRAEDYGLSLILGGSEVTLWEMTGIYASLARLVRRASAHESTLGSFHPPVLVPGVAERAAPPPLSPGAVFSTLQAMLEVERPGVEVAWREFAAPRRVAWKTGTSFGFRDAWAIGVTPDYAVGVWLGNANGEGRPGLIGQVAAAPLLFEVLDSLPAGGWFEPPTDDLVTVSVCRHSGQRAGPHCVETQMVEVPKAGLNGHVCRYCQTLHLDPTGRFRVHGDCSRISELHAVDKFVLPPAMEWFFRRRHLDYEPVPPWRPDCLARLGKAEAQSLSILSPKPGASLYVPLELDGKRGRVVFQVAHRQPQTTVFWHLDDEYVGVTRDIHEMALAPAPGKHTLTLVDANGESLVRRFEVLAR